ncbi:lyase family protein [Microbacterium sp. UFMG61]|uniref:lyase family protein n=1 Tax=Microbacterium sp. UFMG61 TaxID=2745935 RepID=UPI00188F609B|nr:lyase family protein [Microbacterium sp. UFMG61]
MTAFDDGLLSPVATGFDDAVRDDAVVDALVRAELALVTAYRETGMLTDGDHAVLAVALGKEPVGGPIDGASLAAASVSSGNPVIPLVAVLRDRVPEHLRLWIHRGATSQDIVDTALMIVAVSAVGRLRALLDRVLAGLARLEETHGADVVVARTLTQHAVPTTVGTRVHTWTRGVERAVSRLALLEFPAQLAGAAGTRASFVQITGSVAGAQALAASFARHAGLEEPEGSWQVSRWPITEMGDALVQTLDALGKVATDVATLSRTEIGEMAEGAGGGSSAMPHKSNPVESTLIRSASLRAPQLAATLHLAAAQAADERPDGAWHAEWPTLREMLRLALGASAHAGSLVEGLRIDVAAGTRNLDLTGGLVITERLAIVLEPLIGRARFDDVQSAARSGQDLRSLIRALPEANDLDVDALLDPARYVGRDPASEFPGER